MTGENILNRKERKKMKKYEIGNIVKTKEGSKCIILDFLKTICEDLK